MGSNTRLFQIRGSIPKWVYRRLALMSRMIAGWFVPVSLMIVAPLIPIRAFGQDGSWMRELQVYDQKLATIGYRLQISAGDLCPRRQSLIGIAIQDITQYRVRDQAQARQVFGFEGHPKILAVAEGSAFDIAGVRPDDSILAIDGEPINEVGHGRASSAATVAAANELLETAAQDGLLVMTLRRGGVDRQVTIALQYGCATSFQTALTGSIDAAADGDAVEVDIGAMRFAEDDAQIAAVVAHELAHNILRHRERLTTAGVRSTRGARNIRLTRQTEEEADRLSVYLLDRAGYATSAIVSFWSREDARSTALDRLHGTPVERITTIKGEIARLDQMKAAGVTARPAFMMSDNLPPLR